MNNEIVKSKYVDISINVIREFWASIGFDTTPEAITNFAEQIVTSYISTSSTNDSITIGYITTLEGGAGGGTSKKPSNLLNFRSIVALAASGGLGVAGAIAIPWTAPLVAIVIWDMVYSKLELQLSENEAAIIWTMWQNRDAKHCIPNQGLLDLVNAAMIKYGRIPMSNQIFEASLSNLECMRCIKKEKSTPLVWRLIESVRFR